MAATPDDETPGEAAEEGFEEAFRELFRQFFAPDRPVAPSKPDASPNDTPSGDS